MGTRAAAATATAATAASARRRPAGRRRAGPSVAAPGDGHPPSTAPPSAGVVDDQPEHDGGGQVGDEQEPAGDDVVHQGEPDEQAPQRPAVELAGPARARPRPRRRRRRARAGRSRRQTTRPTASTASSPMPEVLAGEAWAPGTPRTGGRGRRRPPRGPAGQHVVADVGAAVAESDVGAPDGPGQVGGAGQREPHRIGEQHAGGDRGRAEPDAACRPPRTSTSRWASGVDEDEGDADGGGDAHQDEHLGADEELDGDEDGRGARPSATGLRRCRTSSSSRQATSSGGIGAMASMRWPSVRLIRMNGEKP